MAVVCVVAALAAQIVVPALHATVHALERGVARAKADRWRVEGAGRVAREEREREHGHSHGARHHHEHPGDRPGEHGVHAPEHLNALIVPTAAPVIPPRAVVVDALSPAALRDRLIACAPRRIDAIRGPPAPV